MCAHEWNEVKWTLRPCFSELCVNEMNEWTFVCLIKSKCFVAKAFITESLTVDFVEVKTVPTEFEEKCFQMMLSAYLYYSKAPQIVLMFHLRKRSDTL